MKAITIKEILDSCNGNFIGAEENLNTKVTSIVTDSRQAKENSMFVAIKGEKVDGHKFVPQAVKSGASAVVISDNVDIPEDITVIKVDDTRKALAYMSAMLFGEPEKN